MFPDVEFTFESYAVESGVADQPVGDNETLKGAATRAFNVFNLLYKKDGKYPDYAVGIEGGIEFTLLGVVAFAYVYIRSKESIINYTKTTPFLLPPEVGALVGGGVELGNAIDEVFNKDNNKQKEGVSGILTNGIVNRQSYYIHALTLVLIPYVNKEMYAKKPDTIIATTALPPCGGC